MGVASDGEEDELVAGRGRIDGDEENWAAGEVDSTGGEPAADSTFQAPNLRQTLKESGANRMPNPIGFYTHRFSSPFAKSVAQLPPRHLRAAFFRPDFLRLGPALTGQVASPPRPPTTAKWRRAPAD